MRWLTLAWKMLRPRTVLMMLLFTAIGDAATKQTTGLDYRLILAAILLGGLFVTATTVNDIADEEIDKINLPNDKSRPLITSDTGKKQLKLLNYIAFAIALVAAFAIRPVLIVLVLVAVAISYIYSVPPIKISHRGILAPLTLSISYVVLPYIIGLSFNPTGLNRSALLIMLGLYVSFIGRIILKDFRDIEGDSKYGKRTFIVRYGATKTCQVAGIAWIIGDIIISSLYLNSERLLILLVQLFVIAVLLTLYRLAKEKSLPRQLTLVTLVGRLGNSVALLILTMLTLQSFHYSAAKNGLLLGLVGLVSAYAAYYLLDLYIRQGQALCQGKDIVRMV